MESIYIHVNHCFGYHAHFLSPHGNHECIASLEPGEINTGHVWIDGICVYSVYLTDHNIPYSASGLVDIIQHVMGYSVIMI